MSRFHYMPGAFNDPALFEKLKAEGREARREVAEPGATSSSTSPPRRGSSGCSATTSHEAGFKDGAGLEAHHRREAVRHRSGLGARAEQGDPRPLGREPDLPRRPLPRQGDGAEPPRLPLLQRHVRAALEQELHRQHPVQRRRGGRRRGARRVLRLVRRAPRHDAEPHVPDARVPLHGGAGLVRAGRDPQREGQAPPVGPGLHAGEVPSTSCAASTARRATTTARSSSPATARRRTSAPSRNTETYAAARLHIDNWRWEGVPVYLRSGKALWKRGTEIIVEFKKAPEVIFRGTPVTQLGAESPASSTSSRTRASRSSSRPRSPGRGCSSSRCTCASATATRSRRRATPATRSCSTRASHGDATLFSRGDLVEAAWRVAQPMLDAWKSATPPSSPTTRAAAGARRPRPISSRSDGRRWHEVITEEVLRDGCRFSRTATCSSSARSSWRFARSRSPPGSSIIKKGDIGRELYLVARGEVEVLDDVGQRDEGP